LQYREKLWQITSTIIGYILKIDHALMTKPADNPVENYMDDSLKQPNFQESDSQINQATRNQLLLEAIAKLNSIRDIQKIWQETARILGGTLGISHCLIFDHPLNQFPKVVAEYHQDKSGLSMVGKRVPGTVDANVQEALNSFCPVVIDNISENNPFSGKSGLIMASSYDRQPNGLIYLYQGDRSNDWSDAELAFVQQLAEQVGYCIAHLSMQEELKKSQTRVAQLTGTIENFLHNISDKLRNPLNAIIGSLNLVLDDVLEEPDEQREFIQDAHHASVKLLHIINDLLHFSNLRDHKIAEIELGKPVKLSKIFQEVEQLTQPRADYQNLYLNFIKSDNFDEIIVSANESRLLQVCLNLVGNAIKFTHSGGVTITYQVLKDPVIVNNQTYPGLVEIQVCDTGIGVATEYLNRVFEPFFQVHDPKTSPYPGTGLGLSISKKLIELMGGKMNFYSMGEGLGSTVIFTVPLNQIPPYC
jgi:signal transduction histidine kinase